MAATSNSPLKALQRFVVTQGLNPNTFPSYLLFPYLLHTHSLEKQVGRLAVRDLDSVKNMLGPKGGKCGGHLVSFLLSGFLLTVTHLYLFIHMNINLHKNWL